MAGTTKRFITPPDAATMWAEWGRDWTETDAVNELDEKPEYAVAGQLCRIVERLDIISDQLAFLNPAYRAKEAEREQRRTRSRKIDHAIEAFLKNKKSLKRAGCKVRWALQDCAAATLKFNPDADVDRLIEGFVLPRPTVFKEGTRVRAFYEEWLKNNEATDGETR